MENIIFAVGISTGNASIICSLFMWVCFFFLGQYLRYTQNYTTGYADTEEQAEEREQKNRIKKIKAQGGNVCLLYTSPSPRDLSTSRMPSSA